MFAQLFDYAKNYWTAYFKRVSIMVCELHFNKSAKHNEWVNELFELQKK